MKKIITCMLLAFAALMFCNVANAQTRVYSADGDCIFTISSANKIYLGDKISADHYQAVLRGSVLDIEGSEQTTVFKDGTLYFNGEPAMKTTQGKTYVYDDDGYLVSEPAMIKKGLKVYDAEGNYLFRYTQEVSNNMQTTIVFFLALLASIM